MSNKIAIEALKTQGMPRAAAYDQGFDDGWNKAIDAAIATLEAMEAGGWLPLDSAPKDGTYIHVQQQATYRWLPYKQASQEFKRGKKGRWQRYTGYGFDNADLVGSGWMNAELPTPPKDAP